jgi:hypothetical protein
MENSMHISKNSRHGSSEESKEFIAAKNTTHHLLSFARIIAKIRARKIYNQTKQALRDVQLIEDGKMKAKSIDDFLNEL